MGGVKCSETKTTSGLGLSRPLVHTWWGREPVAEAEREEPTQAEWTVGSEARRLMMEGPLPSWGGKRAVLVQEGISLLLGRRAWKGGQPRGCRGRRRVRPQVLRL